MFLRFLKQRLPTETETRRARSPLTFKSKLVEFSSQVVDHHSLAVGLPQPFHSVDEVRHHLVDGVGVGLDVFGLQHPRIQDAAYALPLGTHSTRRDHGEKERSSRERRQETHVPLQHCYNDS